MFKTTLASGAHTDRIDPPAPNGTTAALAQIEPLVRSVDMLTKYNY